MKPGLLAIAVAAALSGCALEPTSIGVTAEHDSHALQHIGGAHAGEHGKDSLGLEADWVAGRVTFSLGESYSVHGLDGCLSCPREAFAAQVRYDIWHK